nr:LEPR-XLL domain-containing protein [Geminicoccaceae bacterium]
MAKRSRSGFRFETLEPRLLLSADLAPLHTQPDGIDVTLAIDTNSQSILLLDNKHGGVEIERHDLHGTDRITLRGGAGDDRFRIALDAGALDPARVVVRGGGGHDRLDGPALDTEWSLKREGDGEVGNITFRQIEELHGSDASVDRLTGPRKGADWTIDADGTGTVADTSFADFDHLIGGARGDDTFIVTPKGGETPDAPLALGLDGGGGRHDGVIVQASFLDRAAFTTTGPGTGTIEVDGMMLSHANMTHVNLLAADAQAPTVADYTYTAGSDASITVSTSSTDPTQLTVTGDGSGTNSFAIPTASLTILAPGDYSAVTLNSMTLPAVDLTVQSGSTGVNLEPLIADITNTITVSGGSVIDTVGNGGTGGDITFEAAKIEVQSGAEIFAHKTGTAGDVTLHASNLREATGFITDELTSNVLARNASISIDGAVITGGNIDIRAEAGDRSLDNTVSDYAQGAPEGVLKILEDIQSMVGIPVSILYKKSAADIDIGHSTIEGVGDVSVDADSESDGTGTATFFRAPNNSPGGFAFIYVQTDASATVEVDSNSAIVAGDDLSVTTEATAAASGTGRVSQNFGRQNSPTNQQNLQTAIVVGNSNITSTIDFAAGSQLQAFDDVSVVATGSNSNGMSAETESYKDGLAGLSLGLALSSSNVKVTADGRIESSSTTYIGEALTFNPFTTIDPTNDTIDLGSTAGLETGDAFTYHADQNGGPARGLTDNQTYYLIVVDATHVKLAETRSDAKAGTAIELGSLPALQTTSGQERDFAQIMESTGQIVFDYDPGFAVGQTVHYAAASGLHINGLQSNASYTVSGIAKSAGGSQWLVSLKDSSGNPVSLNLDPAILDAGGNAYAFNLAGSAIRLETAQPSFTNGQAFTYREALGLHIPTLTDGQTYYLVKDPGDGTGTVYRLAASQADATASDGFSNTVALGSADTSVTSGQYHTLDAVNPGGISIQAVLTVSDSAGSKVGQGGEPELGNLLNNAELLPVAGNIISNIVKLGNTPSDQLGNLENPVATQVTDNVPEGSGSNTNFSLAASLGFVNSINNAVVEVGGTLKSHSGVSIDAQISHQLQSQSEAIKSPDNSGNTTVTFAGAAGVGLSFDNAQVTIDGTAVIDASRDLDIDASVTYPFMAPLSSPGDFFGYIWDQFKTNPIGTLGSFTSSGWLVQQDLASTWVRAVDNDPNAKVSVAGAIDFSRRKSFATIDVNGGAQINQDTSYQGNQQRVSLDAETVTHMITIGGIFDYDFGPEGLIKAVRMGPSNAFQIYGAQGGKAGFGGAYRQLVLDNTTHAIVHGFDNTNGATSIHTGSGQSVEVRAGNDGFILGLTQAGASAGKFGISGSAAYTQQTTHTVAAIESGTNLTGGGGVSITANEDMTLPTYAGDVVKGGNLGIGVSLVFNEIDRTVQAYFGDINGTSNVTATQLGLQYLTINAETNGHYFGFSLAAAKADTDQTPSGGTNDSTAPVAINPFTNQPFNSDSQPSGGSYGIAVSGDVVFNQITDTTQAILDYAGVLSLTGGSVALEAYDNTELLGVAGAAAIVSGKDGSAGLAGSYAENRLITETLAQVHRGTINISTEDSVTVTASQGGFATAVAAGGSGGINHADGSAEIAGSVAINVVTPVTAARIDSTLINTNGDVTLSATDTIPMLAIAGAASFGGKAGIGASAATNLTHWTSPVTKDKYGESVVAQVSGATINQSFGKTSLTARIADPSSTDPRIIAVAGSLGAGKTIGVSGTVALNDLGVPSGNAVEASIINGSSVTSTDTSFGGVVLSATTDQTIYAAGGEVALTTGSGGGLAFGVGIAMTISDLPVTAYVTDSSVDASSLDIEASIGGTVNTISAGAGVSTNADAIAGSAAVNDIDDVVNASIYGLSSSQSVQTSGAVTVAASNTVDYAAGAGDIEIGKTGTGGAAIALNDLDYTTQAVVGSANVQSGGTVEVTAESSGTVDSIAAGAQGAQQFALGGSIAMTFTGTTTQALVEAEIVTPASIKIAAESDVTFVTVGGNVDIAVKGVAVGVANATLVRKDKIVANAYNASLDFGGAAGTVDVQTGLRGKVTDAPHFSGLSITALSSDDVTTVVAGGAVSGQSVAAAGSATVTMLEKTVSAFLSDSVQLPNTKAATNVNLLAHDGSKVNTGAGGLAASSSVGIGAAVDVVEVTKDTEARFALTHPLTISGDLSVQALSSEDLLSVAVGAGLSGNVGIGGAASAYVLDLETLAAIGTLTAPGNVTVGGSVQLAAQDDTRIDQFPGGVGVAGAVGVGGSASVVDVKHKDVTAIVYNGVGIHALAGGSGVQAATGELDVAYNDPSGQTGDVPPPNVSVNVAHQTGDSSAPAFSNENLTKERQVTPDFQSMNGIAVSALNTGVIKAINFSGGGGATAAVALNAGVNIVNMTTQLHIADNVTLNSGGDVVLASGADLQKLGVTGAVSGAGTAAGVAGADVTLVKMTTHVELNADSGPVTINAGPTGDVLINAQAQEDILAITAGFAASGVVSLDAGATVVKIDNNTLAATVLGPAHITAGGNVLVQASDDTVVAGITGEGAIGLTGGGFGGAAVVTLIDKTTSAYIDSGSTIQANAKSNGSLTVLDGGYNSTNTGFTQKAIKGVAIQATTSESVEAIAVCAAGGTYVGAGAGVTVTIIDSDTVAYSGADINPTPGADLAQSVSIASGNLVDVMTVGGGLGVGAAGVGGSVDIGIIRNDSSATIGAGTVNAYGDIDVVAPSLIDVDGYAISAGFGGFGFGGSVSLWNVGTSSFSAYTALDKNGNSHNVDTTQQKSGSQYGNAPQAADGQTQRGDVTKLLGTYSNVGGANGDQIGSSMGGTSSDLGSSQPNNDVQNSYNDTSTSSVVAQVDSGASVVAIGDVTVNATEIVDVEQVAGAGSIGLVSVGGSVAILNLGRTTTALMDGSVLTSGKLTVEAGRANLSEVTTIVGTAGGFAGLGAQVSLAYDHSDVAASIGQNAQVSIARGGILVQAETTATPNVTAVGGQVSIAAAGGVSISFGQFGGWTTA